MPKMLCINRKVLHENETGMCIFCSSRTPLLTPVHTEKLYIAVATVYQNTLINK